MRENMVCETGVLRQQQQNKMVLTMASQNIPEHVIPVESAQCGESDCVIIYYYSSTNHQFSMIAHIC